MSSGSCSRRQELERTPLNTHGLDAVRLLRRDKDTKHVPIVACTALEPLTFEIEARDAGCDEFVPKPCEPEVLRDLLEAMVTRTRGSAG